MKVKHRSRKLKMEVRRLKIEIDCENKNQRTSTNINDKKTNIYDNQQTSMEIERAGFDVHRFSCGRR